MLFISGDGTVPVPPRPLQTPNFLLIKFECLSRVTNKGHETDGAKIMILEVECVSPRTQAYYEQSVDIPDTYSFDTNGFVRVFELIDNDWVQSGQALF